MWGKGALIAILGFTMTFSFYKLNLSQSVITTDDHINVQYMRTILHQNAVSGINIGIHKAWNEGWSTGNFNIVENSCTTTVSATQISADSLLIKSNAWGYIHDVAYFSENNTALQLRDSIAAYFSTTMPVSRYFWYTEDEGGEQNWNKWISTDTVSGPVYSKSALYTYNAPVFNDKVITYKGLSPDPTVYSNSSKYYGGWEVGIEIPIPTNMTAIITAAIAANGIAPLNTKSLYNKDTAFEFMADGNVIRTVETDPPDTLALTDIAPTGVIFSTDDVRLKGVLNGQLTIYTSDDIWIDDNLIYANDPTADPSSDDILGLIAKETFKVSDNVANNSDCSIQACIMAWGEKFEAENYATRPLAGELEITGSIVQKNRGRIGNFDAITGIITNGFVRKYRYDQRLTSISPPFFPSVQHLRLLSWWE